MWRRLLQTGLCVLENQQRCGEGCCVAGRKGVFSVAQALRTEGLT